MPDVYEPGRCPRCGADWRVGPASRVLVGVRHCTCRAAVGGVHPERRCQDCDVIVLGEPCEDPSERVRYVLGPSPRPAVGPPS